MRRLRRPYLCGSRISKLRGGLTMSCEHLYDIWLSLALAKGGASFRKLLSRYSSAKEIYLADREALASVISSRVRDFETLSNKSLAQAKITLDFCLSRGVGLLSYFDEEYPRSLREIKNPPQLLYYRGKLPDFNSSIFVSIVGTRRLSNYGRSHTYKIARELASAGATVVSGLAKGIDGVALAAAASVGKPTVAIIGSGIDVCYPKEHLTLAREIVKCGCVMTEYPPHTKPDRFNFPKRNRIISALSEAVLVMEGREESGSLITAEFAAEQGKKIYAFPGNVGNDSSVATLQLIKGGARLFTDSLDVINDIPRLNPFDIDKNNYLSMNEVLTSLSVSCVTVDDAVFYRKSKAKSPVKEEISEPACDVSPQKEEEIEKKLGKRLLGLYQKILPDKPTPIENLIDDEYALREVMQGVLKLEISGYVEMLPGDRVRKL